MTVSRRFLPEGITYVIPSGRPKQHDIDIVVCVAGVLAMSKESNRAYYARRATEEIALGDEADSSSIAAIHFELGYRYSLLAEGQAMSRQSNPSSDRVDASQRPAWSQSAPVHNSPWPRG